ncbi:MAG: RNA 2',3'-cyclic phosphodiesterase [Pseudomonadota bacterium]
MAEGRLFFALWPERKVRDRLFKLAKWFNPQGGRLHHPDDLHITLVFLGQVDDSQHLCIQQVADTIDCSAFTLQLDTIGHWPRPRILWCGPAEQPDALQTLVKDLQKGLLDCGFEPERRRYSPHVTLHRKVRHAEAGLIDNPIEWQAGEFVLATSWGGVPGQPRYRILHRWSLN